MVSQRTGAIPGAVGGLVGGAVMTALMTQVAPRVAPQRMLPSTPVPIEAVRWAEAVAGRPGALSSRAETAAGLAAHAVFSAGGGAAYGFARARLAPVAAAPVPAAGALFGLALWAATFQGVLPALGVKRRTTEHPPVRWPAPLVGHAVFGVVTAVVTEQLARRRRGRPRSLTGRSS